MSRTRHRIRNRSFAPSISARNIVVFAIFLLFFSLSGCAKQRVQYPSSAGTGYQLPLDPASARKALKSFYSDWQGVPYKTGGMSQRAVDCSGLTVIAYRDVFGMNLPRTAEEQARHGRKIARKSLQPGDLVFFNTGLFQRHVGIYLEKSSFIHASATKGVMISRLDEPYWQDAFWKASRFYSYHRTASN